MRNRHVISYREMGNLMESRRIPEGAKIWFRGEKQGYTVRASNTAYVILTKPFNARKTVLYTIIDWESRVRGAENLIFSMGVESEAECRDMLQRLTLGESEVSSRNYVDLDIVKYQRADDSKIYIIEEKE